MAEKVALPKEVAEAIRVLRTRGKDNRFLIEAARGLTVGEYSRAIHGFAQKGDNFDKILRALVNDYEVEQTPEEIKLERFVSNFRAHNRTAFRGQGPLDTSERAQERFSSGYALGVIEALDYAEVTVKGINA